MTDGKPVEQLEDRSEKLEKLEHRRWPGRRASRPWRSEKGMLPPTCLSEVGAKLV